MDQTLVNIVWTGRYMIYRAVKQPESSKYHGRYQRVS